MVDLIFDVSILDLASLKYPAYSGCLAANTSSIVLSLDHCKTAKDKASTLVVAASAKAHTALPLTNGDFHTLF